MAGVGDLVSDEVMGNKSEILEPSDFLDMKKGSYIRSQIARSLELM